MRYRDKLKRIVSCILVIVMVIATSYISDKEDGIKAYEASEITVDLVRNGKVDVMLVSRNTDFTTEQMQALENNLKGQLSGYDVNFVGLETTEVTTASTDVNFAEVVNSWTTIGAPTWTATSDGYIYSSVGPDYYYTYHHTDPSIRWSSEYNEGQNGWWGTGLINPNSYETDNIEMDFTLVQGGTLNEGVCFFVTRNNDGSLNGYFFNVTEHMGGDTGLYQLRLWKMTNYQLDQSFTAGLNSRLWCWDATHDPQAHSSTSGGSPWVLGATAIGGYGSYNSNIYDYGTSYCMATWTLNWSGNENLRRNVKYHVSAKDGHIVIIMNETKVVDIYDNTYTKGTYGFWGNNCEQVASMYLKDFKVSSKSVKVKTMTEILRDATWRDDAIHVVIDLDKELDPTLTESGELTTRLINDNVYLQFWGTNTNQTSFTQYGQSLGKDGNNINKYNFVNQSIGYNSCVNATANYIKQILQAYSGIQYGIINEITDIRVTPSNAKNNTADATYPNGKWKILHDDTKIVDKTLTNGMGISNQANMSMNNLTCTFDKPGNYTITYMNIPIKTVYIHRRPIAEFNLQWNKNTNAVSVTDMSYDLDTNLGDKHNGIQSVTWKWKKIAESSWNNGVPTTWSLSDGIVMIQLTVKDYQGCTTSIAKYLGDTKPIASFSFNLNPVSLYDDISILNSSYDTTGYDIVSSSWVIKNLDGVQLATNNTNNVGNSFVFGTPNGLGLAEGNYKVYLKVKNSNNVESEIVSRLLYVSKVTSHAIYDFNWKEATHGNYVEYANVFYRSKYPTLVHPTKYYTISYDKNTGTKIGTSVNNYSNNVYSTFDSWHKNTALTSKIVEGTTEVTYNGNHTIYAKWNDGKVTLPSAEKKYTVTYQGNGTALDSATTTKTSDTETWTFNGWFNESSTGTKMGNANEQYTVSKNQTLYAQWIDEPITLASANKNLVITYSPNGGISTKTNDTQQAEFKGWFTSPNGGTKVGKNGDIYTVTNNHNLYAQWGKASFVLPNATKDGYEFLGWFDKAQSNGSSNNNNSATYIGKSGDIVEFDSSMTLYAWYNSKPVFSDTDISNIFYEGQTINGNDLLQLVKVTDLENGDITSLVELVSVTYNNGTVLPLLPTTVLDTRTSHIGSFWITYQVTDMGISINNGVITSSPITITYTREFEIRYNDLPSIELEPYIYTYNGDTTLTKDTIETFIKDFVTVKDAQDDVNNEPWWNNLYTKNLLRNNIKIEGVSDIGISESYLKDNPSYATILKNITNLKELYALKTEAPNAFNAITSYRVTVDVKDQWGKYASGLLDLNAVGKLVTNNPSRDKVQSKDDRTLLVICTNDSIYNNAYDSRRFISSDYLNTINKNSYWGEYGKEELESILKKGEEIHNGKELEPEKKEFKTFTNKDGTAIKLIINDYVE